jgi:serine protease inhibitor
MIIAMTFIRSIFLTAFAALIILPPGAGIAVAAETNNSVVPGNTAFAFDLYSKLSAGDGNLFFSPYSISTCLSMVYTGARGETAEQMARVLHFDASPTALPPLFGALQQELNAMQSSNGIQLNIANGLWGQENHPFLPEFLQVARQDFEANLKQVDFTTQAESARNEINAWVSAQTKDKINNLIPPGALSGATRLVLVNAIYFKGRWSSPFKPHQTASAPFFVTANKKVQTPMMHIQERFRYAENGDCQLLELPYASDSRPGLSMIVLLPRKMDGLKQLEKSFEATAFNHWLESASFEKVNVFLPKFKLTSEFQLGPTLAALGMTQPFTAQADFSGMDGAKDLFISSVVHKAYVDVNEEGTEAAAATGVVVGMNAVMRPRPVPVFRADHPFVFMIRDERSGSILFLGRTENPAK